MAKDSRAASKLFEFSIVRIRLNITNPIHYW